MASRLGRLKVVTQNNKVNSATVLFLHGYGDTGPGLYEWIEYLIGDFSFPHIKLLFPTAPLLPYTADNGTISRIWFDRYRVTPDVPEHTITLNAIGEEVKKMIQEEVADGVPLSRVIIGGFSMGGTLALHTAYRFMPGLRGVFALSSFLNDNSAVYQQLQTSSVVTPLFMCHGHEDTTIPFSWGKTTFDNLGKLNIKGEFLPLRNTAHEINDKEIGRLFDWIRELLP